MTNISELTNELKDATRWQKTLCRYLIMIMFLLSFERLNVCILIQAEPPFLIWI